MEFRDSRVRTNKCKGKTLSGKEVMGIRNSVSVRLSATDLV